MRNQDDCRTVSGYLVLDDSQAGSQILPILTAAFAALPSGHWPRTMVRTGAAPYG